MIDLYRKTFILFFNFYYMLKQAALRHAVTAVPRSTVS